MGVPAAKPAGPLSASFAEHSSARASRRTRLEASLSAALSSAAAVENDARVCLGLELQSVASNQKMLDSSVRDLVNRAAQVSKQVQGHTAGFDSAMNSIRSVGSLGLWLTQSEGMLNIINDHLAAIEGTLSKDA